MPSLHARATAHVCAVLALLSVSALGCGSDAAAHDEAQLRTQRSAVVGAIPSTTEDDFVVYLTHIGKNNYGCGATLIAPNLVVTAKHCLHETGDGGTSRCDATGEPTIDDVNGRLATPRVPPADLAFHGGFDAKKRVDESNAPPEARGKQILDDGTLVKCSHDIAFVVLDRPMATRPIARVRLGKRPVEGGIVAVAGWGQVEDRILPKTRQRRTDIAIQRVGPAVVPPNPTGTLGPRIFETGPGACSRDSGGPAFDVQTGTAIGVIARALNLDLQHPSSPCAPDTVNVVYMTVADFPDELRAAFAAAGAKPWLEGRAAPGFLQFGDACSADLECEGGLCEGASVSTKGLCNVSCKKQVGGASPTCPAGYTCGPAGGCIIPPPAPPPPAPTPQEPVPDEPEAQPSGCSSSSRPSGGFSVWTLALLTACVAASRHRRMARARV